MRILITNDDGIHADGLEVLEELARHISSDIWVVAPEKEQSGASHSLTLSDPVRLRQIGERRFAVSGTPTDCVLMAVSKVMPEKPDLVLSGVNRGQNIADDVTYSGTIAAAMEGCALGISSIAISQSYGFDNERVCFDVARNHGPKIITSLAEVDLGPGAFLNVNFPDCAPGDVTGAEVTRQGKRDQNNFRLDERIDARGNTYFWFGFRRERSNPAPGTDLWAIYNKTISITPLHLNLTQIEGLETVREALNNKGV